MARLERGIGSPTGIVTTPPRPLQHVFGGVLLPWRSIMGIESGAFFEPQWMFHLSDLSSRRLDAERAAE